MKRPKAPQRISVRRKSDGEIIVLAENTFDETRHERIEEPVADAPGLLSEGEGAAPVGDGVSFDEAQDAGLIPAEGSEVSGDGSGVSLPEVDGETVVDPAPDPAPAPPTRRSHHARRSG